MKKIIILTLLVFTALTIKTVNLNGTGAPVAVKKIKLHSDFALGNILPNAQAAYSDGLKDTTRLLYFTVAGFPSDAVKTALGSTGDTGGMVGIAANYMAIVESVLASNGITACSAIPSSGTYTGTSDGTAISLVLATPVKVIPTGYPNAGSNYDKRVQMSVAGNPEMNLEFNCDRKAGWFLHSENGSGRLMEFFYDVENTNAVRAEFI